jgi:hypothetical protein
MQMANVKLFAGLAVWGFILWRSTFGRIKSGLPRS